jgi:hypothetical protein
VRAQAVAFGTYGTRTDSDYPRHLPVLDASDSALAGSQPFFLTPRGRSPAVTFVLLDGADRVRGVIIGTGGADRRALWYELARPGPKWSAIIDRLHGVDSSSSANSARDAALARGPIRAIPLGSDVMYVQPTYSWRVPGAPTLVHVTALIGDSVRSAPTLAQLAGALSAAPTARPELAGDLRTRVAGLYSAMRDALRRGDWAAFGQAFDALGKLINTGPPR